MNQSAESRILYADILRIFATIEVVVLHTAAPAVYRFNDLRADWWWTADIIDSSVRSCVPLFFMLSGFFILGNSKKETTKAFLIKRAQKVLIPFFVWSLVYTAWLIYNYNQPLTFAELAAKALYSPAFYHLWFLYAIIGLYLLTPVLRVYLRNAPGRNVRYLLILWFLFASINPFLNKVFNYYIFFKLDEELMIGYTGYFILGYYLNDVTAEGKYLILLLALVLASIAATFLGTYFLVIRNSGALDPSLYNYQAPNVVIMSLSIFIIFKSIDFNKIMGNSSGSAGFITYLSSASFGVYLIHPIVIALLGKNRFVQVNWMLYHPAVGITVTALLATVICFLVVFAIKKVPYIRSITP